MKRPPWPRCQNAQHKHKYENAANGERKELNTTEGFMFFLTIWLVFDQIKRWLADIFMIDFLVHLKTWHTEMICLCSDLYFLDFKPWHPPPPLFFHDLIIPFFLHLIATGAKRRAPKCCSIHYSVRLPIKCICTFL